MSKVAPKKSAQEQVPSVDSTRSFLKTFLERIDEGDRFGLSPQIARGMRLEIARRLDSLDEGPQSGVQERQAARSTPATIPASNKGKGRVALDVTVSGQTAQILEQYFPRDEWGGSFRPSVAVLGVLIEQGRLNGSPFVHMDTIARITGYSVSTIKSEFTVLRNMKGIHIKKERKKETYRLPEFSGD